VLYNLLSGSSNIAIGYAAGLNYTGAESNNIIIGNPGVQGESDTIRIGTSGTQTAAYIAGGLAIDAVTGGAQGAETINASGYYAGGTAGVSAGSFSAITAIQTVGGIVTVLTGSSDKRLKTNIKDWDRGLNSILKLKPASYQWNKQGQKLTGFKGTEVHVGFIAQDVKKAVPEAVTVEQHPDGEYLAFSDRPLLAALVNSIHELKAENDALRQDILILKTNSVLSHIVDKLTSYFKRDHGSKSSTA
jgi:hypothetical protein